MDNYTIHATPECNDEACIGLAEYTSYSCIDQTTRKSARRVLLVKDKELSHPNQNYLFFVGYHSQI